MKKITLIRTTKIVERPNFYRVILRFKDAAQKYVYIEDEEETIKLIQFLEEYLDMKGKKIFMNINILKDLFKKYYADLLDKYYKEKDTWKEMTEEEYKDMLAVELLEKRLWKESIRFDNYPAVLDNYDVEYIDNNGTPTQVMKIIENE